MSAFFSLVLIFTPSLITAREAASQNDLIQASADGSLNPSCSELMYRVLPGEFNFCLARKYWLEGKYGSAEKMFELSAGWGNKFAQSALGAAYFNGDELQQDRPLGLAWLALAAEHGAPGSVAVYQSALSKITLAEKRRAEGLYAQLREQYRDDVAAARADRHFLREVKAMTSNPVYSFNSSWCIANINGNGVIVPPPSDGSGLPSGCSSFSERTAIRALKVYADRYFDGWKGHVMIGPVETIPGGK